MPGDPSSTLTTDAKGRESWWCTRCLPGPVGLRNGVEPRCNNESMAARPDKPVVDTPLYQAMIAGRVDYRPWAGQGLTDEECFLCTATLIEGIRTVEDVFPRWLQRKIAQKKHKGVSIELPNLTYVQPERIKIPACKSCNGVYLSRIEKIISQAFPAGRDAVAALPEKILRAWFAKIAYGTRRNDMRLKDVRSDPHSPMIAREADLEGLSFLHLLLQEARDVVSIPDGHSTFFTFQSQHVGCSVCDFDVALPIGWPHPVMLRLGSVTVMGAVDDRGSLEDLRSHPAFVAAATMSIHPIQVRALWALLVHRATLLRPENMPVRFGVSQRRLWVERLPPIADVVEPVHEQAFADKLLRNLIQATEEELAAHGGTTGLLVDANGQLRQMPFEHGLLRLGVK